MPGPTDQALEADVREAWVLRHSGLLIAAGSAVVGVVLVLGFFVAPRWGLLVDDSLIGADEANAEDGIRTQALGLATAIGAGVVAALAWGRLDLSRQENRREEIAHATGRYTAAVEQLGSADPAVRLGGLYALEALAHDSPTHRTTIADVICGYVRHRTPRRPSEEGPNGTGDDETVVRQRLDEPDPSPVDFTAVDYRAAITIALRLPAHWSLSTLDLRGVVFVDLDASRLNIGPVDFREAEFRGKTWFNGTTFRGDGLFRDATFEVGADFGAAVFNGIADFDYVHFAKPPQDDNFNRAKRGPTWDHSKDGTSMMHRRFRHELPSGVRFSGAAFHDLASFQDTRFECSNCEFEGTQFEGVLVFEPRALGHCSFSRAEFKRDTNFYFPSGADKVRFGGASFEVGAEFNSSVPDGFERGSPPEHESWRWFPTVC